MRSLLLLGAVWLALPRVACIAQTASATPTQSATPSGSTAGFHFAGLAWGSNGEAVRAALAREGLRFVAADSAGDLSFAGTIIQRSATALAWMSNGRLIRLDVRFSSVPHLAAPLYREVYRALVGKYGVPSKHNESFEAPYAEGDGKEDAAFSAEKGHFISQWKTLSAGETLLLFVDAKPAVSLVYASPEWAAEEQRRKTSGGSDF